MRSMNTQNIRNNPYGEVHKIKYSKGFSREFSLAFFLPQESQNPVYFLPYFLCFELSTNI